MSDPLLYTLISTLVVSAMSVVGIATLMINRKLLEKMLLLFISLSAGALLGDVFFHLLPELIHDQGSLSLAASALILAGIIGFFILEQFLIWHHHHQVETPEDHSQHHHKHSLSIGTMNLVGDAFHNLLDGMIIATGYLISPVVGVSTTLAVLLHEIPQEIGDFGVLIHSGYSVKKALFFNFITAVFAVLGALITFAIGSFTDDLMSILIPLTAGGFIYIACSDLIPELKKEHKTGRAFQQLMALLAGIMIMFGILFADTHEEQGEAYEPEASHYDEMKD
ncbi:MAG: ZIP family metal transporter [bacterium]|nr:ZIP family metal transporter [bacterium]